MIAQGDQIPSAPIKLVTPEGTTDTTTDAALGSGQVVLFSVPGAFTPTCHINHLPGFIANADKLKAAGVDRIVCATANDEFVVKAWAKETGAVGVIDFIADGTAALAKTMGLEKEFGALGTRFIRSAMLIKNGVVQNVYTEAGPGVSATGAPAILMALEAARG
jgi:glutaredoxin/glutathione-dependent peroxiredoxin